MTRLGIISDIHGNLHATLAVLARLNQMEIHDVICLGDVVGYGPAPDKCLELVRTNCRSCVIGNHERAVIDPVGAGNFNVLARHALRWTRNVLQTDHFNIIQQMPAVEFIGDRVMCVHDTPTPSANTYITDGVMAARAFRGFETQVCLFGHTHVPAMWEAASTNPEDHLEQRDLLVVDPPDAVELHLEHGHRYLCNPGSVGQPRDNDPRASFAVLDLDRNTFTVHREEYDIDAAREASEMAGLPVMLGQRLAVGA